MSIDSEIAYFFVVFPKFEGEHIVAQTICNVNIGTTKESWWEGAIFVTNYRLCVVSEPGFISQGLAAYKTWRFHLKFKSENQTCSFVIDGKTYHVQNVAHVGKFITQHIADNIRVEAQEEFDHAIKLCNEGNLELAVPLLKSAQAKDPDSAIIPAQQARIFFDLKNYDAVFKFADYVVFLNPSPTLISEMLVLKARALIEKENFNEALEAIEGAITDSEQGFYALYVKGLILYNLERFNDAVSCLSFVVEHVPEELVYREFYIFCLIALGDYDSALDVC